MSSNRLFVAAAIAVSFAVTGAPARAQVFTGEIAGTLVDFTGHIVAGATVKAVDAARAIERSASSDASGFFRIRTLAPGTYEVTISAQGFATVIEKDVVVAIDSTARLDRQLNVAVMSMNADVVAATPMTSMAGGLGMVMDRQRIESLPLNRRDFLQLALLTPGVQGPVDNSELSTRGAVAMHANGAREEFNNYLLDGVDNNDAYVNRYVVQPSVDAIEEFKVATNGYSAEYGRNAGGQVNVITRSGTNRLDGSAYEYFRDESLDAKNHFDTEKQPFGWNQFGGVAGGPLLRDRTFLFGAIDFLRAHDTPSRLGTVPSAAARTGDLRELSSPVFDPFTGKPFAGNIIPSSRISTVARQVVGLFPAANRSDPVVNYLGSPRETDDNTQGSVRVDHRLSAADRLMARFHAGRVSLFEPYTEGTGVTAGFGDFVDDRTWNVAADYSRVLSSAFNSLRFGANGFGRDLLTENHDTDAGALWGVKWLNVAPTSFGYPAINVAGYSRVGDAFSLPLLRDSHTYQIVDDLSIDRGRHLLKMGGEFRHVGLDSHVDLFSRGSLSFTGAFTGSGIGDLLLGLPTFGIQAQIHGSIALRTSGYAAYVQDEWRATPSLTVNLGLRYEYLSPPIDDADAMTTFDFATGRQASVGTGSVSRSGVQADRNNFGPRVGASWAATDTTVVRAAYGVFYDSGMLTVNTSQFFNPPQFDLRVFFPSEQGLLTLDNPFPTGGGFAPPPTLSVLSPDFQSAYLQHWNVSVAQQLSGVGTVTIAYAGSKGSHLVRPIDANQPVPGPGDVQARRPFPAFGDIFVAQGEGRSRFDSLQVSFNRPLARHLSLLGAYTLSKSMDDASAFLGTPADPNFPQDSRHPDTEWAPSSYDVRHRLSLAYIVTLPGANPVTRDMQVEGIAIVHSGQPFTPLLRFDNSNTGNTGGSTAGADRPNLVGNPESANPTADAWFNTQAFAIPAPYTFGNAGRNGVTGPGYASFDIAVDKRLAVGARSSLTIGLQVFNAFNHTNFDLPEHYADEPSTFGRIFSAKAPREVQLTARFHF